MASGLGSYYAYAVWPGRQTGKWKTLKANEIAFVIGHNGSLLLASHEYKKKAGKSMEMETAMGMKIVGKKVEIGRKKSWKAMKMVMRSKTSETWLPR